MNDILVKHKITPVELQQYIYEKITIRFHMTHIGRLMHKYKLSTKRPNRIHVNHVSKQCV